jgi:FKBP-type peptidyl-prolyl cis-trans isomerase FkpA
MMRSSSLAVVAIVLISALAAACGGDSGTSPSPSTPTAAYSQTDLVVGTGTEAVVGKSVLVHYSLWFYDPTRAEQKGSLIETSTGGQPAMLTIATGAVIGGWVRGVPGMRVGGRRRLVLPPDLAYGAQAHGSIPPNSSLVFDIELVAVQ